jgi:cytochrome c peroxidase
VLALSLSALACKEAPKEAAPAPVAEVKAPVAAPPEPPKPPEFDMTRLAAFKALPADMASEQNPSTPERVALGKMLYFDKRLSKNQDVSCNSCHALDKGGVDGEQFSKGHKGQLGGRNSPTVYNAALHLAQFWDGRAATVEDQAKGPVLNPVEMAMPDSKGVEKVLASIPQYVEAFAKAFPGEKDPVSFDNAAKAIAAFERKLVTPARWDKFLGGDKEALTQAEKDGFNTFMTAGCVSCHMGVGVGGGLYQKLGLVQPWPNQKDQGRFEVTKAEADKMMFKVPSLRNIHKTAPYFHDGSAKTLPEAIKLMARHQVGKELTDAEVASIATFLGALSGDAPAELVAAPELPASTAKTPKPDPT